MRAVRSSSIRIPAHEREWASGRRCRLRLSRFPTPHATVAPSSERGEAIVTETGWWLEHAVARLPVHRMDGGSGSDVWKMMLPSRYQALLGPGTAKAASSAGAETAAVLKCLPTDVPATTDFGTLLAAAQQAWADAVSGSAGDAASRLRREAEHLILLRELARDTGAVPVLLASLVDHPEAAYMPGGILMEHTGDISVAELTWSGFRADADDLRRYQLRQWEVVGELHARGVVHRDIHPGNERLERDDDGRPRWESMSLVDLGEATSLEVPQRDAFGRAIRSHPEAPAPYRAPDFDADHRTLAEKRTLDYHATGQCVRALALADVHLTNAGTDAEQAAFTGCPDVAAVVGCLTRPLARERDREEIESLLEAVRDNVDAAARPVHEEAPRGARPEEESPLARATPEHDVEVTDLRTEVRALEAEVRKLQASLKASVRETATAATGWTAEQRARTQADQARFQAETARVRAESQADALAQASDRLRADLESQVAAYRAMEEELARERAKVARLDADAATSRIQREAAEVRAQVSGERTAALEEQLGVVLSALDEAEREQQEMRLTMAAEIARAQDWERRAAAGDTERAQLIVRVRTEAQLNLEYADALRNSAEQLLKGHAVIEELRAMREREQAELDQMNRMREAVELLSVERDSLERMVADLHATVDRVYEINEIDPTATDDQDEDTAQRQAG